MAGDGTSEGLWGCSVGRLERAKGWLVSWLVGASERVVG
jgi:hypothetical protein